MNPLHLLWIIPLTFILGYIACALLCANGDADKKTERNAPYWATEQAYKNGYQKGYEDGKRDAVKPRGCPHCDDGRSFIGAVLILGNDGKWHEINYCPNCGKDLRGENDA